MSQPNLKEGFRHSQLRAAFAAEREQIRERVFAPNETTRDGNQYFLPFLPEYRFGRGKVTYEKAKEQKLKKVPVVRILDLGCGAGFWMEEQAQNPRLEVFGITARDYRRRADRPEVVFLHHDDCYLFDPARVLKQVHRVLAPNGYAFLESFRPTIYDRKERLVTPHLQKLLEKDGHLVRFGEYCPDELRERVGLAIKKNRPRLRLPLRYRHIEPNPTAGTSTITYYLD